MASTFVYLVKWLHCMQAMAAFPDLENYSNAWPVTDIIMMRLKYTSSWARLREIEMAAGRSRRMQSLVSFYSHPDINLMIICLAEVIRPCCISLVQMFCTRLNCIAVLCIFFSSLISQTQRQTDVAKSGCQVRPGPTAHTTSSIHSDVYMYYMAT